MNLYPVNAGNFKLDGGAMFGAVPKTIWNKTNPADQNNLIDIAARCLLIEDGKRLILIDSGMGNKQSEKFFSYYSLWGEDTLERSIKKVGFSIDDVTDVFFTHLHFDHCGGAIKRSGSGFEPVFKNAIYWTNKKHWDWAINPNKREVASFLKENLLPIEETGNLGFIPTSRRQFSFVDELGFKVFYADGHTEKQMLPIISHKGQKIAFAGDLIPTAGHVPLPYVMGYDVRPLTTLKEKDLFLNYAADNNVLLLLEHDSVNEVVSLKRTEKGVRVNQILKCNDVF
ncbi:MBL fold metallo-hydrolase [Flavobacteriaceae bacterium]|nr:MBL fold metallo-hydrolase [Flavobacteriaceae bacterium]